MRMVRCNSSAFVLCAYAQRVVGVSVINLYGPYVDECWQLIASQFGQVLTLDIDCVPIRALLEIHRQASRFQIRDGYRASEMGYRFLMECCRHFFTFRPNTEGWPPAIVNAVMYMHDNYAQAEGLEQIAAMSRMSNEEWSHDHITF